MSGWATLGELPAGTVFESEGGDIGMVLSTFLGPGPTSRTAVSWKRLNDPGLDVNASRADVKARAGAPSGATSPCVPYASPFPVLPPYRGKHPDRGVEKRPRRDTRVRCKSRSAKELNRERVRVRIAQRLAWEASILPLNYTRKFKRRNGLRQMVGPTPTTFRGHSGVFLTGRPRAVNATSPVSVWKKSLEEFRIYSRGSLDTIRECAIMRV